MEVLFVPLLEETREVVTLILKVFVIKEQVISINFVFSKLKIGVWFVLILECLVGPKHFHVSILGFSDCGRNSIFGFNKFFVFAHIKLSIRKTILVNLIEFSNVQPFFDGSTIRTVCKMLWKIRAFYFL